MLRTYPRPDLDLRRLSSTAMTGAPRAPTRVSGFAFLAEEDILAEEDVRSPLSTTVIFVGPMMMRVPCFAYAPRV